MEKDIQILQETQIRYWCHRIDMPGDAVEELCNLARQISGDPHLFEVFLAFYEKCVIKGEWYLDWGQLPVDGYVSEQLGQQTSMFYLLGYLAGMPAAFHKYQDLGINPAIFDATFHDITHFLCEAHDISGYWCFDQFGWIWRHLTCALFRLGRLQFMLLPFPGNIKAFRNRSTQDVILLADPALPLRSDGYAEGAGGKPSGSEPWQPCFQEKPNGWIGHPISPRGSVLQKPVYLHNTSWELLLQNGDMILDLHIPRSRTLLTEDCRDSFRQAFTFFPHYWPNQPFHAVYCHTWLFTPQLEELLPPTSSILNFQLEFYLYPFPGGPDFLWNFVFGPKYQDMKTAPRDTTLRQNVIAWLEQDKELFDLAGLMFHSPEEWGTQPYQKGWTARLMNWQSG